jgi:hypothetical protein
MLENVTGFFSTLQRWAESRNSEEDITKPIPPRYAD